MASQVMTRLAAIPRHALTACRGIRDRVRRDRPEQLLRTEAARGRPGTEGPERLTNAEHLIEIMVALTATGKASASQAQLYRRMAAVRAAAGALPRLLDPDGEIRTARALYVRQITLERASSTALHRRQPRIPSHVQLLALLLIIGLEAVFIATFIYANVKQGRSWLSLEGAVSVLVGLVHPVVVAVVARWIESVWSHDAGADGELRKRRSVTAAAVLVLAVDAACVWTLTTFIFNHALTGVGALTSGISVTGFPVWVMAALFTILPVVLVFTARVNAEPTVAEHDVVLALHRRALEQSRRAEQDYKQSVDRLHAKWLALHSVCVELGRRLQLVTLTGEYRLLVSRASMGPAGPWPPVPATDKRLAPGTDAALAAAAVPARDAVSRERLELDALVPPDVFLLRNLDVRGPAQVLLRDLEQAVVLLRSTVVPTPQQVHSFLDEQLGGPAAVETEAEPTPPAPEPRQRPDNVATVGVPLQTGIPHSGPMAPTHAAAHPNGHTS